MIITADEKYVNTIGRTLFKNGIRYLGYSCSAIEFVFTGSRAEAVLWSNSPSLEDIYKAWVAVFIDDEETPSKRFPVNQEEASYVLYEGETVKEVKLRLVKYSEAAFGKVGIKSIEVDCDEVYPTAKRSRRLEIIGDSITCGYGNEGIWNVDVFNTTQENPWEAYAAKTARRLDADYHLISWSGIGIISNWTDQDVPNVEADLMPGLYPYTDKSTDLLIGSRVPELWDHSLYVPDCIIINLGTNDSSYTKNITERVSRFGEEYVKFVKAVRAVNPSSKILCTLGAMGQDLCKEIERRVEELNREGDSQIYYMAFDVQSEADGIGSDWHPSIQTHDKMADKLEARLKEILAW